jgi:thymidine phosphorylase
MRRAFESGAAAEYFARMVAALGGPADFLEKYEAYLPAAPVERAIYPLEEGTVLSVDARAVGVAVVELGGGRRRPEDTIDPAVGLEHLAGVGHSVDSDAPLAIVHAADEAAAARAAEIVQKAYRVGPPSEVEDRPVIAGRVGPSG